MIVMLGIYGCSKQTSHEIRYMVSRLASNLCPDVVLSSCGFALELVACNHFITAFASVVVAPGVYGIRGRGW